MRMRTRTKRGWEVGQRWERGRVSDVSDHNAGRGGAVAMAEKRVAQIFQRPPSEPGGQ